MTDTRYFTRTDLLRGGVLDQRYYTEAEIVTALGGYYTEAEIDTLLAGYVSTDATTIGTAWTGLTFGTGWTNFGSGYASGQYKKVGDLVFLRGLVTRTSGTGLVIATLPSGYRPLSREVFNVETSTGDFRMDIMTTGSVELLAAFAGTWVTLSGIVFSVL